MEDNMTMSTETPGGAFIQQRTSFMILLMLFSAACVSVADLPEGVKLQASFPEGTQSVLIRRTVMQPGSLRMLRVWRMLHSILLAP